MEFDQSQAAVKAATAGTMVMMNREDETFKIKEDDNKTCNQSPKKKYLQTVRGSLSILNRFATERKQSKLEVMKKLPLDLGEANESKSSSTTVVRTLPT